MKLFQSRANLVSYYCVYLHVFDTTRSGISLNLKINTLYFIIYELIHSYMKIENIHSLFVVCVGNFHALICYVIFILDPVVIKLYSKRLLLVYKQPQGSRLNESSARIVHLLELWQWQIQES